MNLAGACLFKPIAAQPYELDLRMPAVAMERPRVEEMPKARVLFEYYPPHRRYDIHNIPSSLKAYIDGIADAMGCDDRGFDVDYPTQWAGVSKPGKIVIHVRAPLVVDVPIVGEIS